MPTGKWVYKVTAENPDWKGSRVVVRVSDLPGNVVEGNAVLDGT
jgi:hypothetical protein